MDHVPPIFGKQTFVDVAGGHGTRSVRETLSHLEKSARKIADAHLHTPIRSHEVLPTQVQVNRSHELDVLLGEIVRVLAPTPNSAAASRTTKPRRVNRDT
jgi:hypothetical protein